MPGEFDDLIPPLPASRPTRGSLPSVDTQDALGEQSFIGGPTEPENVGSLGLDLARATGRGLQNAAAGVVGLVSTGDIAASASEAGRQARETDLTSFEGLGEGSLVGGFDSEDALSPLTTERVRQGIEGLFGRIPQPETLAGKLTERAVEFGAGAVIPLGAGVQVLRSGAVSAVSGATSELLGQFFEGTKLEGAARLLGAISGGVAGARAVNRIPSARTDVLDATVELRPGDFERGRTTQSQAQAEGIQLTGLEALQSDSLKILSDRAAESGSGRSVFDPVTVPRTAQIKQAISNRLDDIGAPTTAVDAGRRVQQTSRSIIEDAESEFQDAIRRFQNAAGDVELPAREIERVRARTRNTPATAGGPLERTLESLQLHLTRADRTPETNGAVIEAIVQNFKKGAAALDGASRRKLGPLIRKLDSQIKQHVEPVREARGLTMALAKDVLSPILNSPLPRVAGAKDVRQALRIATDALTDPDMVSSNQIRRTFEFLGQADPNVPASIVRIHLERAAQKAANNLRPGPNQLAGALFRNAIFGTGAKRKTVLTMINELDRLRGMKAGTTRMAIEKTLRVFDRIDRLGKSSPTTRPFGQTTARPGSIAASLTDELVGDVIAERRMRQIAELLTAPNSVMLIEQIATSADPRELRLLLAPVLSGVSALQPERQDHPL